jgi:hypothetical protein
MNRGSEALHDLRGTLEIGAPLAGARSVIILLHGRGSSPARSNGSTRSLTRPLTALGKQTAAQASQSGQGTQIFVMLDDADPKARASNEGAQE